VLTEVKELSNNLSLSIHSFVLDDKLVDKYKIDKIPATIITDKDDRDFGIRFYGIPAGYEFVSLMHAIKMVGDGDAGLHATTVEQLKTIDTPVHLQVFVTPTCPYCPAAVQLAHSFAYLNHHIVSDMVEASEFTQLANKFNVMGVPKVIINDTKNFEGSLPESLYLHEVLKAIGQKPKSNLKGQLAKLLHIT
jgi:glutaredoxin-like protein